VQVTEVGVLLQVHIVMKCLAVKFTKPLMHRMTIGHWPRIRWCDYILTLAWCHLGVVLAVFLEVTENHEIF